MAGGQSWTPLWLQFDNSYFQRLLDVRPDPLLLRLPTDEALLESPEYLPYCRKFASNQEAFFLAYSAAHKKFSELGAKFDPPEGVYLD
jgi:L-ascorbate peroxidase